ncbi:AlkA N-terminal domain-containing protein [Leifsonia shinshuensis]|uniref:DNA-3-methyladenine glycosylase II n=1 Tax=Leifsonia shinshuensis TaxID=150026 RepID=A0A853CVF1_9MICO|nr:AlkA N-terminal domain-containing protein [Leifsonia shinshuensis]NYJ24637.1 AraC family transcriptional regulator of adaptative response / DNA-3-methyladenine glycosylase II [Leifsonia shinshuensis]
MTSTTPTQGAARRPTADDRLADPVFARRYRAMSARDARFDGQFITGVHSTGIYCRPSCPAVTPKADNVTFYLTAAAAHEAGLRACKRCLPDAVPGSPEWNVRDDLAARAMRLIADGTVEREGVPGLARRLGYTPRHLGRVLTAELGAGPLALARAHRAQTARLLLAGTDMPVTDVAFAAGFSSVRQFNETMAEIYHVTPGAIRASARRRPGIAHGPMVPGAAAGASLSLRLPARAPFDGGRLLAFLGARAIAGMETAVTGGDGIAPSYSRALRLPHGPAAIRLTLSGDADAPAVECEATLADMADLAPLVARVRRLLDLDADAEAIDTALAADPVLAPSVAAAPGIRVPGAVDPEEILFRALIGQQVSVAAARTALARLTDALGEPVAIGGFTRLFPTAQAIAEHGREVLRGPGKRIDAIVGAAAALADGSLAIDVGESRAELEARLIALPGIGAWTAGYVALRVLGSPDVLLTGDLALRQGAARLGLPAEARALAERGAAWSPWRSYAGMHLWESAHLAQQEARAQRPAAEATASARRTRLSPAATRKA